jgi:tRNA 2-thiouridine synthesizing protein A
VTEIGGPSADDLVVDQRGRRCPLPVIELARRILDVPVGGVVCVVADDPAAATDIAAWCGMRGHELVGSLRLLDAPAYRVRRTA